MKNHFLFLILFFSFNAYSQITPEWAAIYDSSSTFSYYQWQMKVSPARNVYVVGSVWDTIPSFNVLLKYNTSGILLWGSVFDSLTTYAGDMTIDSDENIYLTGRHTQPFPFDNFEYMTLKYDSSGSLLWSKSLPYLHPGINSNMPFAIAVDISGNVYVSGESPDSNDVLDVAIVKYNSSGTQQWIARYDYQGQTEHAYDLIVDSLQNVYVTGQTMDTLLNEYILTLKYDSTGNLLWTARYNDDIYDVGNFIKMDKAGNLFIGGSTDGNGDGRYKLLKYDNDGNFIWVVEYDPSPGHEFPKDMIMDANANIYMTGTQLWGSSFYDDYATVKFDSTGQLIWAKTYNGGPSFDDAYVLTSDASGNIYVTGRSTPPSTSFEYLTIKYDNNGNQLWTASYGGIDAEPNSIALDSSGNIYVSGYSTNSAGVRKIVTLKYSLTTGVEENSFSSASLLISPDPTSSSCTITAPTFISSSLTLYDITGRALAQQPFNAKAELNLNAFTPDIYIIEVKDKEGHSAKAKVVKE